MSENSIELHEFRIPGTLIGGHYFLVLKDSNGNVLHELHGHAYDPRTGIIDYAAINPLHSQRLLSVQYNGATYYNPSSPGQVLWQGNSSTILNIWDLQVLIGSKITELGITYRLFGGSSSDLSTGNSNTFIDTIVHQTSGPLPNLNALTWNPGVGKNLLTSAQQIIYTYSQIYPNASTFKVPNSTTTLFNIVDATGTQATALIAANPGVDFSNLQVGQQINLPPPNNSRLNVSTNTTGTTPQGNGATNLNNLASDVSQGRLVNTGTKTVSMNPADVNVESTGKASALAASNIVADAVRPGNFNLATAWNTAVNTVTSAVGTFFSGVSQTLAAAYTNVANLFSKAVAYIDPLVLDLNGDSVKLTNYTEKAVLFDIDHDGGSLEVTGWVSPQDGIVVHDLNSNGVIDNMSETLSEYYNGTVGTGGNAGTTPFANGFAALASSSLNTIGDGVFNGSDGGWNHLRVWVDDNADGVSFQDVNGNGTYQAGIDISELKTFAQLGITQVNLTNIAQSGEVRDGNEVLSRGTFVQSGQTKEAIAANFLANPNGTMFSPSGSGMVATTQGGVTSYVSNSTTGVRIIKGVGNLNHGVSSRNDSRPLSFHTWRFAHGAGIRLRLIMCR